mmetsp:Transcript_51198/g.77746  ORF Transcript_51198/g.77746 Transcript_51198/m.77746 type:complete len:100 (+) Transcript_51198:1360-1659(+)
MTSLALAFTIIGLLLTICYMCLKKVRLFKKPIIYAIVYILAFVVCIILIAQGIYYFVVRDYFNIFEGYDIYSGWLREGCLKEGYHTAASNYINYIYELI